MVAPAAKKYVQQMNILKCAAYCSNVLHIHLGCWHTVVSAANKDAQHTNILMEINFGQAANNIVILMILSLNCNVITNSTTSWLPILSHYIFTIMVFWLTIKFNTWTYTEYLTYFQSFLLAAVLHRIQSTNIHGTHEHLHYCCYY